MKRLIFLFSFVIFIAACKKDGSGGKKLYLSKVYIDNLLSEEYIYSSDKKPLRRNFYGTSQGQSTFLGFRIYEYNGEMISRTLGYNKGNQLSSRYDLTYNNSDQVTRVDFYGNDTNLDNYLTFEYDDQQQLSKINNYSVNPVKKTGETFLKYDAQNNLLTYRRNYLSGFNWILFDSTTFTYTNKTLPAHWQYFELSLTEFPYERTFFQMPAETMFYYMSGGPPTKSNGTYSNKVYNGAYLTAQQYKLEVDNGLNITTYNYNLKYEYIE